MQIESIAESSGPHATEIVGESTASTARSPSTGADCRKSLSPRRDRGGGGGGGGGGEATKPIAGVSASPDACRRKQPSPSAANAHDDEEDYVVYDATEARRLSDAASGMSPPRAFVPPSAISASRVAVADSRPPRRVAPLPHEYAQMEMGNYSGGQSDCKQPIESSKSL